MTSRSEPVAVAEPLRVLVVYYSATGTVHAMAQAIRGGATEAGADVRLRRVAELAPPEAIDANPRWSAHRRVTADEPEATLEDLEWAEAYAFGSPTRFGLPAAQLKQFLDQSGSLWARGILADKLATSFTTASTEHGGLESTILAMNNLLYHWGAIIMSLGYVDPAVARSGNPYGAAWVSRSAALPDAAALDVCRAQGHRLARLGSLLASGLRTSAARAAG